MWAEQLVNLNKRKGWHDPPSHARATFSNRSALKNNFFFSNYIFSNYIYEKHEFEKQVGEGGPAWGMGRWSLIIIILHPSNMLRTETGKDEDTGGTPHFKAGADGSCKAWQTDC